MPTLNSVEQVYTHLEMRPTEEEQVENQYYETKCGDKTKAVISIVTNIIRQATFKPPTHYHHHHHHEQKAHSHLASLIKLSLFPIDESLLPLRYIGFHIPESVGGIQLLRIGRRIRNIIFTAISLH